MRRKSPYELMRHRNYVAKHASKFNKSVVYSDKLKDSKRGYVKHKGKIDKDVTR
jgi:hypothetical protein